MRSQDRAGMTAIARAGIGGLTAGTVVLFAALAFSQEAPRLTGPDPAMENVPAPPLARPITDDRRKARNYPEQPPVIPHSIEGYQLTLNTNRCLECHRREFVEASGAPMISVTHFMDRDFQVLADVAPRRYFCLQCHVPQTDARPLVENEFTDMSATTAE
ncbi:nitrate reductase cytochrome c-type subunit [Rhizobiales bacterium]|uniref:nitrate reductase cytochrome c-type subunit n=1 Tax=Hongsoonwoonella zoysiae TaxID=2821844 RepID=UPI001561948A|nr:nitrate reductase cytochrome c-type subunit [Hongsoonwoonella zoysiae]